MIAEARYRRDPASVGHMEDNRVFIAIARNHVPAPYDGRVLLLRRRERASEWGERWDLGWKGVVSDLEIRTVGGNRMSIFEEAQVEALAELLRKYFEDATKPSAFVETS
jgi:thioesterase domain-containing protein